MGNLFDFNNDGTVDMLEMLTGLAGDPNNPLNDTTNDFDEIADDDLDEDE